MELLDLLATLSYYRIFGVLALGFDAWSFRGRPRWPAWVALAASAAFPKYDRNLNTGRDNERGTEYVVAHQRVLHDAAHRSHVTLPIIPR